MNETFKPRFTITNSITDALTHIERARGFLDAAIVSEAWIKEMSNQALFSEAHHSTHIEGTTLTEEQARNIWEGKTLPNINPDDAQELLNYRSAYDFVCEYLDNKNPITEALIREIHSKLVQAVRGGSANPGEYRKIQNYVVNSSTKKVIYSPPTANEVPLLMHELINWLNTPSDIHPVLISGIAQFQLVHIHPFLDGNGRTSRLLSTMFLYQTGYDFKRLFSLSKYYDKDRPSFYSAIQSVRENKLDMTEWLEFFTLGLKEQLVAISQKSKTAMLIQHHAEAKNVNPRQKIIIDHLLTVAKSISIQECELLIPKSNRRTLQRDIKDLIEKELLIEEGATHQKQYRLSTEY